MDTDSVSTAFAILLLIVGFLQFWKNLNSGKTIDLDNIEIFREYYPPTHNCQYNYTYQTEAKPRPRPKAKSVKSSSVIKDNKVKKQVIKEKSEQVSTLHIDCLKALISLGHKKKEAQLIVKDIFANHNPKNLQEFINIAFTKK